MSKRNSSEAKKARRAERKTRKADRKNRRFHPHATHTSSVPKESESLVQRAIGVLAETGWRAFAPTRETCVPDEAFDLAALASATADLMLDAIDRELGVWAVCSISDGDEIFASQLEYDFMAINNQGLGGYWCASSFQMLKSASVWEPRQAAVAAAIHSGDEYILVVFAADADGHHLIAEQDMSDRTLIRFVHVPSGINETYIEAARSAVGLPSGFDEFELAPSVVQAIETTSVR